VSSAAEHNKEDGQLMVLQRLFAEQEKNEDNKIINPGH